MEKIAFKDPWQNFFQAASFRRFDDFFDRFEGEQINKNTKRSVLVRTFEDTPKPRTFFMKRFFDPHYKDMVFALWNWGSLCSQGQLEWNCANYLMNHGIKTYQPVCYGHIKRFGLERKSFLLTEKLNGECLMDFVAQRWRSMDQISKLSCSGNWGNSVKKSIRCRSACRICTSITFLLSRIRRVDIHSRSLTCTG